MEKKFGIDVSRWQGDFNFAQAKAEGVEFAIIKLGGGDDGLYTDSQYENSYKKCKLACLPVGAYFFGNARSVADAEREAEFTLEALKGKQFEYPIYYDVEAGMLDNDKTELTDIIIRYCEVLENAGYYVGIYASESPLNSRVFDEDLARFTHWVAKYSDEIPHVKAACDMWQFGGSVNFLRDTKVCGMTVDQNYCYVDFPEKIITGKLNGFGVEVVPPLVEEPVPEVKPTLAHSVGEVVEYTGIYTSSSSDNMLTPSITSGTITKVVEGSKNPYLINDGTGWVNDACIVSTAAPAPTPAHPSSPVNGITPGATHIRIKSGAKDLNSGSTFADFVYNTEFIAVFAIDNYVVFGYDDSRITGKVSVDDVIFVDPISEPVVPVVPEVTITEGCKVSVINPVIYGSDNKFETWGRTEYDVIQVSGDRVVIGVNGVVTAAVNASNLKCI